MMLLSLFHIIQSLSFLKVFFCFTCSSFQFAQTPCEPNRQHVNIANFLRDPNAPSLVLDSFTINPISPASIHCCRSFLFPIPIIKRRFNPFLSHTFFQHILLISILHTALGAIASLITILLYLGDSQILSDLLDVSVCGVSPSGISILS